MTSNAIYTGDTMTVNEYIKANKRKVNKSLNIWLPEDIKEMAEIIARKYDITKSEFMRHAICYFIDKAEMEEDAS